MIPGYPQPAGDTNPEQPYGEYRHVMPQDLWAAYDQPIESLEPEAETQQAQPAPPASGEPAAGQHEPTTAQPPVSAASQPPVPTTTQQPATIQQPATTQVPLNVQLPAPAPGWYPDPSGEADMRMWNGSAWLDEVTLGAYQFLSPLPLPHEAQLPPTETMLWSSPGGVSSLSTHRIWISESEKHSDIAEFPLWAVQRAVARTGSNSDQVEITVGFHGYGGRTTWILRRLPDAPVVAALIHRQAARARNTYYV